MAKRWAGYGEFTALLKHRLLSELSAETGLQFLCVFLSAPTNLQRERDEILKTDD